jgi:predicted nucleic acid-binding protein
MTFRSPATNQRRLLVDANLLVLYVVGNVNRDRIETFKRTNRYKASDFDLLTRWLDQFDSLVTVSHVWAEVSNLTDLKGPERSQARQFLKHAISILEEEEIRSLTASQSTVFPDLGLTDAAIEVVARSTNCEVLTDDLDLYLRLAEDDLPVTNFTHLREQALRARSRR